MMHKILVLITILVVLLPCVLLGIGAGYQFKASKLFDEGISATQEDKSDIIIKWQTTLELSEKVKQIGRITLFFPFAVSFVSLFYKASVTKVLLPTISSIMAFISILPSFVRSGDSFLNYYIEFFSRLRWIVVIQIAIIVIYTVRKRKLH